MRVGVLSDLHIGAPQSNWHDAAALIQSIAPELDAIVLSGDITEELNPYPKTRALMNHNLNSLKLRIRQELNRFVEMISENISKILFLRGNHDDRLLNQCPLVEDYAVLHSKFGRIIILHGHQTNLSKYGLRHGWGVQAGRQLKASLALEHSCGIKLKSTDYLIVGHCHVAYCDIHTKIYSPGCWLGSYRNRNTGWYLLIDDEVQAASPRSFIQLKRKEGLSAKKTCECGLLSQTKADGACPVCQTEFTTSKCGKEGCSRPLRGEDPRLCKKHQPHFKFWE